jgi:hypothetical protein
MAVGMNDLAARETRVGYRFNTAGSSRDEHKNVNRLLAVVLQLGRIDQKTGGDS